MLLVNVRPTIQSLADYFHTGCQSCLWRTGSTTTAGGIKGATERTPVSKHAILWLFTSQSIMVHKPSVAVHSSHATSTTVKSIVKDRQSNLVVHRTCKHQVSSTWIELLM
ncbi:hypothetical protein ABBQ38_006224 [Trebouxia sp. C0009 RCD-2024]